MEAINRVSSLLDLPLLGRGLGPRYGFGSDPAEGGEGWVRLFANSRFRSPSSYVIMTISSLSGLCNIDSFRLGIPATAADVLLPQSRSLSRNGLRVDRGLFAASSGLRSLLTGVPIKVEPSLGVAGVRLPGDLDGEVL